MKLNQSYTHSTIHNMSIIVSLILVSASCLLGQNQQPPGTPQQITPPPNQGALTTPSAPLSSGIPGQAERLRPNYVLQIGDQLMVRARDVEELTDRPFRIESDGTINLPLVGRIKAAELTVEGLEAAITQALRTFIVNPQVSITVTQFKTDPVFLVGAFRAPGIYPLVGRRTLVELLSSVGGVSPNASRKIRVSRRIESGKLPLANATISPDGRYSTVDINTQVLQTTVNAPEDLELMAYDIISAEKAEMIFTTGAVGRIGGIELGERESLSMLQALALAGGLSVNANRKKAVIFRPVLNTARRAEIPLDLEKIMRGESNDFPLLPNDVLYVPSTNRRAILTTAGQLGLGLATSILLFTVIQRNN